MILCERCIHNMATDVDLVVEMDAKTGRVLIPPHCELDMPAFPHAKECSAFYEVPMDGD